MAATWRTTSLGLPDWYSVNDDEPERSFSFCAAFTMSCLTAGVSGVTNDTSDCGRTVVPSHWS